MLGAPRTSELAPIARMRRPGQNSTAVVRIAATSISPSWPSVRWTSPAKAGDMWPPISRIETGAASAAAIMKSLRRAFVSASRAAKGSRAPAPIGRAS